MSRVLAYPKFRLSQSEIEYLVHQEILPWFETIKAPQGEALVVEDPSDDKFVWCAEAGKVHWIISGDDHLLKFEHPKISIVTPSKFLEIFWQAFLKFTFFLIPNPKLKLDSRHTRINCIGLNIPALPVQLVYNAINETFWKTLSPLSIEVRDCLQKPYWRQDESRATWVGFYRVRFSSEPSAESLKISSSC